LKRHVDYYHYGGYCICISLIYSCCFECYLRLLKKLFKKGQYLLGSWKLLPWLPIDVLNFKPPSGAGPASVNPAARLTLFRVIFKLQPGSPGDLDDLVTGNLFSLSPRFAHRYVQELQVLPACTVRNLKKSYVLISLIAGNQTSCLQVCRRLL
jgi:hypothetical protein